MIIFTHHDPDGVLSLALVLRKYPNIKVKFSSSINLLRNLCREISKDPKILEEDLIITDLSGNEKVVKIASAFNKVIWIDHHVWEVLDVPRNVILYLKNSKSSVELVSEYFSVEDKEIVSLGNEIDSNNIKTDEAKFFRDLIFGIKWKFKKETYFLLEEIARKISEGGMSEILSNAFYNEVVKEYRNWLQDKELEVIRRIRVFEKDGNNILMIYLSENLPPFFILDVIEKRISDKFDYIFIIYTSGVPRMEIRSQTKKNVLEIARKLGGGGHINAAGVRLTEIPSEDVILALL